MRFGWLAATAAIIVAAAPAGAVNTIRRVDITGTGVVTQVGSEARATLGDAFTFKLVYDLGRQSPRPSADFSGAFNLDAVFTGAQKITFSPSGAVEGFASGTDERLREQRASLTFANGVLTGFSGYIGRDPPDNSVEASGSTGTYLFDASSGNDAASYSAAITSYTATLTVPEPTTWAMMIGGVGLVGGTLRRKRSASLAIA